MEESVGPIEVETAIESDRVVVHVDPSCPFAWITYRWLAEVERVSPIRLTVRLLSLSVVNEHRQLDDWYRTFNEHAWAPARVMAAVVDHHDSEQVRHFYQTFGDRFHVRFGTSDDVDRRAVAIDALADAGLPGALADAADDPNWDARLRTMTSTTIERLGLDVGVPVIEIGDTIASGPVLTCIPTGLDAVDLYRAVRVLTAQPGFVRLERPRVGELHTE
ncbi:MAG: disulfide bond formation protein DsbA [Ilumatobacteraceae bacterium]